MAMLFFSAFHGASVEPEILDLRPARGPLSGNNEVWIKGTSFAKNGERATASACHSFSLSLTVTVSFGNRWATVRERSATLLTVSVPPCEVTQRTTYVYARKTSLRSFLLSLLDS